MNTGNVKEKPGRRVLETGSGRAGIFTHLKVLVALLVLLGPACGDDSKSLSPAGNIIDNALIFEYENGTEISMGKNYSICCGIWEPDFIDKNTLKIYFYDPFHNKSFWKLFIAIDEAPADSTYTLPTSGSTIRMFLMDFTNSNELSSDVMESSGSITINSMDCGPPVSISLTIDATIGSEYGDMPSVNVRGSFGCTVKSNPAPFDCEFNL